MSIKTTQTVSRKWALSRIKKIYMCAFWRDLDELLTNTGEREALLTDLFEKVSKIPNIEDLNGWSNKGIEDLLDQEYFRESMFDNYIVE